MVQRMVDIRVFVSVCVCLLVYSRMCFLNSNFLVTFALLKDNVLVGIERHRGQREVSDEGILHHRLNPMLYSYSWSLVVLKSGLYVEPDGSTNEQYGACGDDTDCRPDSLSARVSPSTDEVTHVPDVSGCLLVVETEVS